MKVIKVLLILSLFIFTISLKAQEPITVGIGDKLPNLSIKLLGNAKSVTHTELLNNKLLIIDFWATWCVPCLAEIELLDSLRSRYPNEFNVLMVTDEDSTTVRTFFKKNPQYYSKHLNYVTNDIFLNKSFPHRGIPHNIWINRQGIVKAITSGREVKLSNILNFEKENAKPLEEKKDNLNFDIRERLDILNENFTYRSIFGPRGEGLSGMSQSFGPLSENSRLFTYINGSISQLVYCAYKAGSYRDELVEIVTKDSLRFFRPSGKRKHLMDSIKYQSLRDWDLNNTFCYQLVLPSPVPITQFQRYLFDDLERRFNLRITVQTRPTKVIIVKQPNVKYALQAPTTDKPWVTFMEGNKIKIRNATPQQLFDWYFMMHRAAVVPYPYVVDIKNNGVINVELDLAPLLNKKHKEGIDRATFEEGMATLGFTFEEKIKKYNTIKVVDLNTIK